MDERDQQVRVAVLSMAQCNAVANLLRAHGRNADADGIEGALQEASKILCDAFGAEALAEARAWVSRELCDGALRH